MEHISPLLDLPSPSSSYQYLYGGDSDQYLDTHTSDSQSPINSQYDMSYVQDFGLGDVYPSPEAGEGEGEGEGEVDSPPSQDASPTPAKAPAKRKRENRYKNAPPSVLSRRRAQNRASQRAYRERKDQRIKDLEQMLNDSKQRNDVLSQAYQSLHSEYVKLKTQQLSDTAAATGGYGGGAGGAGPSAAAAAYADPSALGGMPHHHHHHHALDLDVFGYPDLATYAHI